MAVGIKLEEPVLSPPARGLLRILPLISSEAIIGIVLFVWLIS